MAKPNYENVHYHSDLSVGLGLLKIPWHDVLFLYVLPRLSWKDIFQLRQVSTEANLLVSEFFRYNRDLDPSSVSDHITADAFVAATNGACGLRRLVLKHCRWLTDDLLQPVLQCNHNLIELDVSGCSALRNASLQVLSLHCRNLQLLSLKNCHWVTSAAVVSFALHCTSLRHIDLTSCWEINDEAATILVSHCPQLKHLSLGRIYGITDETLSAVATYCRQLNSLDITGCWRVTDYGIRLVGEYCLYLKKLAVGDCRDVTEHSLKNLRNRVTIDKLQIGYLQNYNYKIRLQI